MGELVLPSALTDRPFTVGEARAAGVRYDQLRRAPLHTPTRRCDASTSRAV